MSRLQSSDIFQTSSLRLPPTSDCVLHRSYALHHHPGVVLSDARRALVVCASMFQYVVVDLAVRLR